MMEQLGVGHWLGKGAGGVEQGGSHATGSPVPRAAATGTLDILRSDIEVLAWLRSLFGPPTSLRPFWPAIFVRAAALADHEDNQGNKGRHPLRRVCKTDPAKGFYPCFLLEQVPRGAAPISWLARLAVGRRPMRRIAGTGAVLAASKRLGTGYRVGPVCLRGDGTAPYLRG